MLRCWLLGEDVDGWKLIKAKLRNVCPQSPVGTKRRIVELDE